jgi:hypothetical protein
MSDEELFNSLKAAKRKRTLFGYKTLHEPTTSNSEEQLRNLELGGGYHFPADVRDALLSLGGCAIDELYIHPANNIYAFDEETGPMKGFVTFASDVCGNYFAFDPKSPTPETIYYCSHDPFGYAVVAPDFRAYLHSFVDSGFNTLSLTEKLELHEC